MSERGHLSTVDAKRLVETVQTMVKDNEKVKKEPVDAAIPEWVENLIGLIISIALVWLGGATARDIYQIEEFRSHLRLVIASGIGALLELVLGVILACLSGVALLNGDES
jgi:hypothetical protein